MIEKAETQGSRKSVTGKPLNVVWIVVDSVRNYVSGGDDRDKLDIMFSIADETVEFTHTITSAPSSVMAGSAMLTGMPAYYIGRNYEDFKYDQEVFTSLQDILKPYGYAAHGVIFLREIRQKLRHVIDNVDRSYYPARLSSAKKVWSNEEVNKVLFNMLANRPESPGFYFIWYNARGDSDTTRHVEAGINAFKAKGILEESVFILTSDHGYPDPKRGFTPEGLKAKGLTHDLILTDDNIVVPLYIGFPGSPRKRVTQAVSSLDIVPTVLDILEIPYPDNKLAGAHGKSLLPIIRGSSDIEHEAYVRCDSRFLLQKGRTTAIRSSKYKYIWHHDEGAEELYDLSKDSLEENNVIGPDYPEYGAVGEQFRSTFRAMEEDAVRFQTSYMVRKALSQATKVGAATEPHSAVLLAGWGEALLWDALSQGIRKASPRARLDLLLIQGGLPTERGRFRSIHVQAGEIKTWKRVKAEYPSLGDGRYDVIIIGKPVEESRDYRRVLRMAKQTRARITLEIDCNMDIYANGRQKRNWLRVAVDRLSQYPTGPSLILADLQSVIGMLKKRLRAKK
ncbi:sulfatase/phosphatase domain-containing protein [Candidatus Bipolaricaulota bacterium]